MRNTSLASYRLTLNAVLPTSKNAESAMVHRIDNKNYINIIARLPLRSRAIFFCIYNILMFSTFSHIMSNGTTLPFSHLRWHRHAPLLLHRIGLVSILCEHIGIIAERVSFPILAQEVDLISRNLVMFPRHLVKHLAWF